MSHRTRERPAECLASLSHSTMIARNECRGRSGDAPPAHIFTPAHGGGRRACARAVPRTSITLTIRRSNPGVNCLSV
ncbi:hypothetical protein EVAR_41784_1 [Eumeta japonica]|uniref:Uncharacterized protein n=1 Tax=Eumeta variegata TaxID=151549 RepID=A0A4C1W1E5_EUMVA|nr:hypothetical protein EVAR_41784_1 [Eumeta japonica]